MYRISPFTPLFFNPSRDQHGAGSKCVQVFSTTDRVLIEVLATGETSTDIVGFPSLKIKEVLKDKTYNYTWKRWQMNTSTTLLFIELQGMEQGYYTAEVAGKTSEVFAVTSDEAVLADTVLLQYSNRDNKQRNDAVFFINGMQRFFDFRIPGGFKDDNWSFMVENEKFKTSDNDSIDLYSNDTVIKPLTIGNCEGCPVWFAELVNRLLCCNYVYVDGERYSRNESEVPEMNIENEGQKTYVFIQSLSRVLYLDPTIEESNRLVMRRANADKFRNTDIGEDKYNLIV